MNQQTNQRPVVAVILGDPGGIGPELIAKLLARRETVQAANVVLVGDPWLWKLGQQQAGMPVATEEVDSFAKVRGRDNAQVPAFLKVDTVARSELQLATANAAGGRSVLQVLNNCMDAARGGHIDAICFGPLNKHAMKLAGLRHEDELHHFAKYLEVDTYFCEFNTLDGLWTSRISSHVPLKDVPLYINGERVVEATSLLYKSLQANGVAQPRIAVAGLNPHNGEGGTCGREEIDVIAPAVRELHARGMPVSGPFSPDTIFLRARDGELDGIVTMYHDQGQIALKLMGFSRGVTVQGGLPIPITTPAHGTAYDIAGQGKADVTAIANAFTIATRMGVAYRQRNLSNWLKDFEQ